MRAAFAACLLSSVASTLAYTVIQPNGGQGWTDEGQQTIKWSAESKDAATFTPVLVNENTAIWPYPQVLLASVDRDAEDQTVLVSPPAGGWPVGKGFRITLVKDPASIGTVYASSTEFAIAPPVVSSASIPPASFSPGPPITQPTPPSNPNQGAPSGSSGANFPTQSGNGAIPVSINGGLMALVAFTASFFL